MLGWVGGVGSPVLKNDLDVFLPENVVFNLYFAMYWAVDTDVAFHKECVEAAELAN